LLNTNRISANLQDPIINGFAFFTTNSTTQINGQIIIPNGAATNLVLISDINGVASWRDISYILNNGGAFLDSLNDAISDRDSNLFLGNGTGLAHTGMNNTGVGINALRNISSGNGNTVLGFSSLSYD
jgi:hypothetical protein